MYTNLGPQVVVVDDKYEEVEGIITGLQEKGIGCKYLNPNPAVGDKKPNKPFGNVSLLFMDLYFTETGTSYDETIVAGWIRNIVGPNSFYVLVVWSTDQNDVSKLLSILDHFSIAPITSLIKGKSDKNYLLANGKLNFEKLIEDIENDLNNNGSLSELIVWKQGIIQTVDNVISTINTRASDINTNLKKIITAQGGKSIYDKSDLEKREALHSAMDEALSSRSKHFRYERDVHENCKALYEDLNTSGFVDPELNSWFIFEKTKFSKNEYNQGVVFKSTDKKLDSFSFSDSNIFSKLKAHSGQEIESENIYMIINPSCNISQNNLGAGYKLISGLIAKSLSKSSQKKLESFKSIGNINLNGYVDGIMLFDMRYVFTIPQSDISSYELTPIAQFSKSVFNDIQVNYTSYSSRIGYTSLR